MLFAWLVLLPLPFGSVLPWARRPLIATPLVLCALAASVRLYATRDRTNTAQPTRPWNIWGSGTILLAAFVGLQLLPLPLPLLRWISPESALIWTRAANVATLAGAPSRDTFPITIDPQATRIELFRLLSLLAAFLAAALLTRTHARRLALAVVLSASAIFQVLYGVREAALGRYAIWGWTNKLVYGRVTGTFVNPNHFAHYLAIVLPVAVFIVASLWRRAGPRETPRSRRFVLLLERAPLRLGLAALAIAACAGGLLLSQSRGAVLSVAAGILFVAAMLPGRRALRLGLAATGTLAAIVVLALFLGPERTIRRFVRVTAEMEGRRESLAVGAAVWRRYSLAGSGAGTFERAEWMDHRPGTTKVYRHVHNDYVELGATTGTVGFTVAIVTLLGGYVALVRMTAGRASYDLSWTRRAFQAAALASLTIAMTHALVDFNFFIPSNPATLAAIAGAAVASVDHDRRMRR